MKKKMAFRTEKVAAAITQYVRDLGGQVILETDGNGNGNPTADYIYLAGNLVAEYKNNTTYFAHADHLGSTHLLTGINQSVAQNLDYLPFGDLNSTDSAITSHKFTGDERDSESGKMGKMGKMGTGKDGDRRDVF